LNKYLKKLLPLYQKMGVSLIPNRYEEPVPDLRELESFGWDKESSLRGIELKLEKQAALLNRIAPKYLEEFKSLPQEKTQPPEVEEYHHTNPSFRGADAGFYYCLIRHLKPRRIIEIGAGFSTLLAAQAVVKNATEKKPCHLTAIEPYPSRTLREGVPGLAKLLETNVQKVSMSEFESLQSGDILFVDSSHILRTGSDVQMEFLEILPRLQKGVCAHFHDIFLPMDYPRKLVMEDFKFYNEQYLLQAFLSFNREFEVVWAGQAMLLKKAALIEKYFGEFFQGKDAAERYWRSVSFWIRRK